MVWNIMVYSVRPNVNYLEDCVRSYNFNYGDKDLHLIQWLSFLPFKARTNVYTRIFSILR